MDCHGIDGEVLLMSVTRMELAKLDAQIKQERAILREEIRKAGELYRAYLESKAGKHNELWRDAMVDAN